MTSTFTQSIEMVQVVCSCGMVYCIPEPYRSNCQRHGKSWHCPGCQVSWGFSESEADRLRKRLLAQEAETKAAREATARERDRRQAEERSHAATRGQLTKVKRRSAAGVCPCCSHRFLDVRRHMKAKHPEHFDSRKV